MLKLKSTATNQPQLLNRTRRLTQSLVLGATILSLSQLANASPAVNSVSYVFRATMTNTVVDSDARGAVQGNLTRRGAVDNQRLKVTVSKLDADSTYHLVAFLGDNVAGTNFGDFVTDHRGGASMMAIKHTAAHPLPDAVDPLTN